MVAIRQLMQPLLQFQGFPFPCVFWPLSAWFWFAALVVVVWIIFGPEIIGFGLEVGFSMPETWFGFGCTVCFAVEVCWVNIGGFGLTSTELPMTRDASWEWDWKEWMRLVAIVDFSVFVFFEIFSFCGKSISLLGGFWSLDFGSGLGSRLLTGRKTLHVTFLAPFDSMLKL